MLDKSLVYKNIIMRLEKEKLERPIEAPLPDGFSFKLFTPEDIGHWAGIETSVLEFNSEREACDYFKMAYMPHLQDLQNRCLFIVAPDGIPIATTTAWYADSELGYQANLHWVAVRPEYQGGGFGMAVVKKALQLF